MNYQKQEKQTANQPVIQKERDEGGIGQNETGEWIWSISGLGLCIKNLWDLSDAGLRLQQGRGSLSYRVLLVLGGGEKVRISLIYTQEEEEPE